MPTGSDFEDVRFGKDKSANGEYGQGAGPLNGDVPADTYPNIGGSYDPNNSQFSRNKNWEPQAMADEADTQSAKFYELQHFLNNSAYTAGARVCHELKEQGSPAHPSGNNDGKTGV